MPLSNKAQHYLESLWGESLRDTVNKRERRVEEIRQGLIHPANIYAKVGFWNDMQPHLNHVAEAAVARAGCLLKAYSIDGQPLSPQVIEEILFDVTLNMESAGTALIGRVEKDIQAAKSYPGFNYSPVAEISEVVSRLLSLQLETKGRLQRQLTIKMYEDSQTTGHSGSALSGETPRIEARGASTPPNMAVQTPASETADHAKPPQVFVSYSWDDDEHKEWVLKFAKHLRNNGVNVILDRWHLPHGADKNYFMEGSIIKSSFVILVCTPNYADRANERTGGVGYEAAIITGAISEKIKQNKFIPILRSGEWNSSLPHWIKNRRGVDLRGDSDLSRDCQELLRTLRQETLLPPTVGPKPRWESQADRVEKLAPAADAPQVILEYRWRHNNAQGHSDSLNMPVCFNNIGKNTAFNVRLEINHLKWYAKFPVIPQLHPNTPTSLTPDLQYDDFNLSSARVGQQFISVVKPRIGDDLRQSISVPAFVHYTNIHGDSLVSEFEFRWDHTKRECAAFLVRFGFQF